MQDCVTPPDGPVPAALDKARQLLLAIEAATDTLSVSRAATLVGHLESATEALALALGAAAAGTMVERLPVRLGKQLGGGSSLLTAEDISAVLIDLDGTMYSPHGLIDGADDFYAFLRRRSIPHVFLSNTGAKGAAGVRAKLKRFGGLFLSAEPPPDSSILTAAEAQAAYMLDTIPRGAKIFAISGGSDPSFWMQLLQSESERRGCKTGLVASWDVRTHLTEDMAKEWAVAAAARQRSGSQEVFVVLFFDGSISATADPQTGELGHADWSFDFIKKASYMLSQGAHLVLTAEDAFNPSADPKYPGHLWPLPGPGMFGALFRKLMEPLDERYVHVCGKGGREGQTYMMGRAIEMLQAQGHSGELSSILIVGDRFDTDIRAGVRAGIRTCLVESGCHSIALQPQFIHDHAHFVAASVRELMPSQCLRKSTRDLFDLLPASPAVTATNPTAVADAAAAVAATAASSVAIPSSAATLPAVTAAVQGGADELAYHPARQACAPSSGEALPSAPLLVRISSMPFAGTTMAPALPTSVSPLRAWMLTQSNLIYSGGGLQREPLVPLLRRYFDENESYANGRISSTAARMALAALGLLPGSTLEPSWTRLSGWNAAASPWKAAPPVPTPLSAPARPTSRPPPRPPDAYMAIESGTHPPPLTADGYAAPTPPPGAVQSTQLPLGVAVQPPSRGPLPHVGLPLEVDDASPLPPRVNRGNYGHLACKRAGSKSGGYGQLGGSSGGTPSAAARATPSPLARRHTTPLHSRASPAPHVDEGTPASFLPGPASAQLPVEAADSNDVDTAIEVLLDSARGPAEAGASSDADAQPSSHGGGSSASAGVSFASLLHLVQRKFEALGQPHALFGHLDGSPHGARPRIVPASSSQCVSGAAAVIVNAAEEGRGSISRVVRRDGTKSELDLVALEQAWQRHADVRSPVARVARRESLDAEPPTAQRVPDVPSVGATWNPLRASRPPSNSRSMPNLDQYFGEA